MADAGAPHQATGAQNAVGLAQTSQAILLFNEMVERTEQQNGVNGVVGIRQTPGIANFDRCQRMPGLLGRGRARLFDMFGHRIDQVHPISASGKPAGVNAGSATGIDDVGWSGWQMAQD